jgi:hypothetical protein
MAGLTCPNCNAVPSSAELAAGWCDSCGKKIPASLAATAATPKRTAREAYLSHTPKATRGRKGYIGTLIGTAIGAFVSAILMIGPLREAGYILLLGVTFAVTLTALSLGQIVDGMMVKEHR